MRVLTNIDTTLIANPDYVAALCRGLIIAVSAINRVHLRLAKPKLPALYDSGVRWKQEPWAGKFEEFADCVTVINRGWGDCDDLVAWRMAELVEKGEKATPTIYYRPRQGRSDSYVYHVQVRRENGEIEDPSRLLGML